MKDTRDPTGHHDDSWANWLGEGETLLWYGRPVPGFRVRFAEVFNLWPALIFGFIVTIFPALWLARFLPDPPQSFNDFLPFWLQFHLIAFLVLQIGLAAVRHKWRASAHYSLTNQRAVAGYSWPFRTSREYKLPHLNLGMLQDHVYVSRSKPRSIYFRRITSRGQTFQMPRYQGFDYLSDADAKAVYTHLQRMHVPIDQRLR